LWVVYWWSTPFYESEQTNWQEFDTRDQARNFLRDLKKSPRFLKADKIRQYRFIQLGTE